MKKFLFFFFLSLAPVYFVLLLLAIFVDPAHIFYKKRLSKHIAYQLVDNRNTQLPVNFNDRLVAKIVAQKKNNLEILLLGSSRSLQLEHDTFNNDHFYNFSVNGADVYDYLVIYHLVNKQQLETVIIGVDPWIFNKNNNEVRYYEYKEELKQITGTIPVEAHFFHIKELISPSYLSETPKKMFKSLTDSSIKDSKTKLGDGSMIYGREERFRSLDRVNSMAEQYIDNGNVYHLNNYDELDTNRKKMFIELIDDIQKENINVIFLLSPYHPLVYEEIKNSHKLENVENYLLELADNKEIKVWGSYNPENVNFTELDFYDGMHPKRESLNKLFIY